MLSTLMEIVRRQTEIINAFLLLCEMRDEAIANPENPLSSLLRESNFPDIQLQDDRIFRHCAVITHLYGIYEEFVKSSLQFWLRRMPKYTRFSELEESLKNNYRAGIGKVICDIHKRQFSHLSLIDLLERYAACLKDNQPWQFVDEALIFHEINLRRSELERLFTVVGINNFWRLLQNSGNIKKFIEYIGSDRTVESLLEEFVTFRNEASHGVPDEILGSDSLRQWVQFTRTICESIAEAIMIKTLESEKTIEPSCVIGQVSEIFRNNIVVAKCWRCELRVGQHLYFLKPHFAILTMIESLQLNDQDQETIIIGDDEIEVGIRTSLEVKRGAEILNI